MPQGGDSEEKEDFKVRDPPWGVNGLNYILGTLVLGSNTEKISSLDCLEDQCDQQEGCWKPGLHFCGAHTHLLAPKAGQGWRIETAWVAAGFL